MNVKLLRKIQEHILEEPKRFVMRTFLIRPPDLDDDVFEGDDGTMVKFARCGTAACVAGWAVLLHDGMDTRVSNLRSRAKSLIGLKKGFNEDLLFEVGGWPTRFEEAYRSAKTQRGRARVAVRRIDHFIKTKGQE